MCLKGPALWVELLVARDIKPLPSSWDLVVVKISLRADPHLTANETPRLPLTSRLFFCGNTTKRLQQQSRWLAVGPSRSQGSLGVPSARLGRLQSEHPAWSHWRRSKARRNPFYLIAFSSQSLLDCTPTPPPASRIYTRPPIPLSLRLAYCNINLCKCVFCKFLCSSTEVKRQTAPLPLLANYISKLPGIRCQMKVLCDWLKQGVYYLPCATFLSSARGLVIHNVIVWGCVCVRLVNVCVCVFFYI